MDSGAPGARKGPSRRLAQLDGDARYARERYQPYKAKAYGPRLTSAQRVRRPGRESQLADRRLERAKAEARHAEA